MERPLSDKILIVEDDPDIRRLLEFVLKNEGFVTQSYDNGQAAIKQIDAVAPDLAIVDLMLPGIDGIEVCRHIRSNSQFDRMPILVVTARDHAVDKYEAFAVGADDYITKPFDALELSCRVRAFLRLTKGRKDTGATDVLDLNGVRLDPTRYTATVRGEKVVLTRLETFVLQFLMSQPGRVFSAEQLSIQVLGDGGRSVDAAHAHIRNLRQKIEADPRHPVLLVTMGRKGYFFSEGR